jgi:hypothetical protein
MLSVDGFEADEVLPDIERRCRCTACGWRRADVLPDYSVQQKARNSVGYINPP